MLRIFLMDIHGSQRLIRLQPAPIKDPLSIIAWLAIYSSISNAIEDTELSVGFRALNGKDMTAFIVPGNNKIDIGVEKDVIKLYLYARDILPDNSRRI